MRAWSLPSGTEETPIEALPGEAGERAVVDRAWIAGLEITQQATSKPNAGWAMVVR